jgi:hypothetical protein
LLQRRATVNSCCVEAVTAKSTALCEQISFLAAT